MINRRTLAKPLLNLKKGSVLQIKTGVQDDAIYYLTTIDFVEGNILKVPCHSGSLLLDRVSLFGSLQVFLETADGLSLSATLSLLTKQNLPNESGPQLLNLEINNYEDLPQLFG